MFQLEDKTYFVTDNSGNQNFTGEVLVILCEGVEIESRWERKGRRIVVIGELLCDEIVGDWEGGAGAEK